MLLHIEVMQVSFLTLFSHLLALGPEQIIKLIRTQYLALSNGNNNQPPIVGMLRLGVRTHAKFLAYNIFLPLFPSQ